MSKLEKLYEAIRNLKDLGVEIPESLMEETHRVEQEIIFNELIPRILEIIQPMTEKIQRNLTLILHHEAGRKLKVEVPGEENISQSQNVKDSGMDNPEHNIHEDEYQSTPVQEKVYSISNPNRLEVYFPDGTVIREGYAAYTFFKTIDRIGPERVKNLGLKISGVDLVSRRDDLKYRQRPVSDGYFVCTHSNTQVKKDILNEISRKLNLGLRVEIV